MELEAYLTFNGTCEEALNFYKECLNGEITTLSYYDSAPMPVSDAFKNKVLHANFKFGKSSFMASDSEEGKPVIIGTNISLTLNVENEEDLERLYQKLAEGGQKTMPLQDTFWGAKFGMAVDRFGVNWMFNCEKKEVN